MFNASYPESKLRRARVIDQGEVVPTIMASGNEIVRIEKLLKEYRIRKLTPRECWRLMDFTDKDYNKAAAVNSNTQLYKQAGNSIVVNVLVAILGQLFEEKEKKYMEEGKVS